MPRWTTALRRQLSLTLAVALVLGPALIASPACAELKRVNVGMQPIVNGPIYIAVKEKYFEKLGLDVNIVKFTSGPAQFAALAGGQVDLAWGGMGAFLLAKANGQNLNFISVFMDYNPLEALVVPSGSSIKAVKDLAGKKVALVTGSDAHYGLLRALDRAGAASSSVTVLGMAPPQQVAAFERGDVDAMFAWEPFLTPLYDKGAKSIFKNSDLDPGPAFLGWAGKREWLEANADTITKILKGWDMGLAKTRQDPELAIKATLDFTGMSEAQAHAIVKGLGYFDATAALDPKSPAYWSKGSKLNKVLHDFLAFGRQAGLVKGDTDVDGYVLTQFMEAVKSGK